MSSPIHTPAAAPATDVVLTDPADPAYLAPTAWCDADHPSIGRAVANILRSADDDTPLATTRALFLWIRDQLVYTVGLMPRRASETLAHMDGSCSNKANLFVAMLRVAGIPAGFRVLTVKTREYFGPASIPRLNRYLAPRSIHVHTVVWLDGRWIAADATDDIRLSLGLRHLAR